MYQPQDKDRTIYELTGRVQQLTQENQSKDEQLRSLSQLLEQKDATIAALQQQLQSLQPSPQQPFQAARVEQQTGLVWETLPDAPEEMWATSAACVRDKAYFLTNRSKQVYEFDLQRKCWKAMPKHPVPEGYAVVCIDDTLTTVGGYFDKLWGGKYSNKLYSFVSNSWVEQLPSMPTKRSLASVAYGENMLVVSGGHKDFIPILTVEVLNVRSRQWSSASSIPYGLSKYAGSTAICGGYVYMATCLVFTEMGKNILYRCSLSALAQSKPKTKLWQNIDDQSTSYSTMVVVDGQLVAVGGRDARYAPSREILRFDSSRNAWEVVGHMTVPRSDCLVAVLPGKKLMVVGAHEAAHRRKATVAAL